MSAETIRIPAVGAVFWAEAMPDGSPGPRAIAGAPPAIKVTLTAPLPPGVTSVSDSRGLVLQAAPPILYPGLPTESELSAPLQLPAAVNVTGTAQPLDGRFHPRQFSVSATLQAPAYVLLRPSLQGTSIGEAGALVMNLQWQSGGGASWSVVNLTCTRNGVSLGFTGQADVNGDVIVPLSGLPPLPGTQQNDGMTLTILGDPTQYGLPVGNSDALNPVQISIGSGFAAQQTLPIVWGKINTAATLKYPGFIVQPS
jgi:hypothetical protein